MDTQTVSHLPPSTGDTIALCLHCKIQKTEFYRKPVVLSVKQWFNHTMFLLSIHILTAGNPAFV